MDRILTNIDGKDDVEVENDESVRDDPDKTWVFKRYVSCTTHGCLGEKRVAKEQVWKKKKNGLYV